MATVRFDGVTKRHGTLTTVDHFDLTVAEGELVVLVGGSGSGKSTTLRMLAGLETVTEGTIRIGDRDVTHLAPRDRDVAMVFQDYALYPHLTVEENISLGLRLRKVPREERDKRVRWATELLDIGHLLTRRPSQLSGGQRQRVAMGRAIVREPAVFLFDEPLSNLDAKLRGQMRVEIASLQRRIGTTSLYVTHDQVEAMTLADRIVVLDQGRIQQVGKPMDVYRTPANRFVAGFLGSPPMNFVDGELSRGSDGGWVFETAGMRLSLDGQRDVTASSVTLGLRPEDLIAADGPAAGTASIRGEVALAERLGGQTHLHIKVDRHRLVAVQSSDRDVAPGSSITLNFELARAHLFGADGLPLTRSA